MTTRRNLEETVYREGPLKKVFILFPWDRKYILVDHDEEYD